MTSEAQLEQLRARVALVRRLHQPVITDLGGSQRCGSCDVGPDDTYPCPTIRALDGAPITEENPSD